MKRPVIGVTPAQQDQYREFRLKKIYTDAVIIAGGVPFILPIDNNDIVIESYLEMIDGLLLTGGFDLDPLTYGENPLPGIGSIEPERDRFELKLYRQALEKKIPVLGICKGCQLMNTAGGGNLYQDLEREYKGVIKHDQTISRRYPTHYVTIDKDSLLYQVCGREKLLVNSLHHQALKEIGQGFKVTARADDGVIEAIEMKNRDFVVGVQWHPEGLWQENEEALRLFKGFISAASKL